MLDSLGRTAQPDPEDFYMQLPDSATFQDITSNCTLPPFTRLRLTEYYLSNEKDFESKYEDLYKERLVLLYFYSHSIVCLREQYMYFLCAITLVEQYTTGLSFSRFCKYVRLSSCSADNMTYVCGAVWAEMRKVVSYKVDIMMTKEGMIEQAQCECGAGQGPTAHCKHVACILLALLDFTKTKTVHTERTCTQVYFWLVSVCPTLHVCTCM